VVLLLLVSGLSVLGTHPASASAAGPSGLTSAALPPTHGDLLVTPGEVFVIQPTPGSHVYYQGGNITVERGGTLIVRNVTLTFVQFVSNLGTPSERLSHLYHFIDNGTVHFYNSTVTTDVQILNAYAKLNVTVLFDMTLWNSSFEFPGWLNVEGAAADLTLNDSVITANPGVQNLAGLEPSPIFGDTSYATSIAVTGGAEMNAFNSSINATYADNTVANGRPAPAPLSVPFFPEVLPLLHGSNLFSQLITPNDSANLSQDWLYPNANFQAGNLVVDWNNPNLTLSASVEASVWYNGIQYEVAVLDFQNESAGAFVLPLPSNLLQNITNDGVLDYLNWTGDFGAGASRISIEFDVLSGPHVVNATGQFLIYPSLQYDILVSGAGTTINTADTSFNLNWNSLPANSTSQLPPVPWKSNKLLVSNGATAYLANATMQSSLPGVFSTSAVIPDDASQAFFYRWAQFNITGRGGFLPIPDAQLKAYYAYSTNQTDNATANGLNDLATANPAIWGYVQYWDAQHGVPAYGASNLDGRAALLLASTNITGPTLPDGLFLGGYHIGVIVPAPNVTSHWINWSVSPYPTGVAQTPPAVAGPDFGPVQQFSQYFGAVVVTTVTLLANNVASSSVYLGQLLDARVLVTDIGTAPITQVAGGLYYDAASAPLATFNDTTLDLTAPGQQYTFNLDWRATANITGTNAAFDHNLTVLLDWNYNNATLAGGNLSRNLTVQFAPTIVTVTSAILLANGVANATVELGQTLGVNVTIHNVGNGTINDFSAQLFYNQTAVLAQFTDDTPVYLGPGGSATFLLSWKATENITGLQGWFTHNLSLAYSWNNDSAAIWLGNGAFAQNVTVMFAPSQIAITSFSLPPTTLNLLDSYFSSGTVVYNGSHAALFELWATPLSNGVPSGSPILIAEGPASSGKYSVPWLALTGVLAPGTSYSLRAEATYNDRSTNYTVPGVYSVPPSPSSPASFLFQTFLGLPLWVWLAIAAAAVVAILLFLLVARRQAAGKLVECGECGNLIPEDATVCPKCGAEFESDLIRCSRCASTIPANSKFCPECAAQLLGAPGEAESDPEKQAYADFTEKYRAEAKKELGDNYSEGGFWDWWKRQPTYTPFSQWSLQQGQGTARAGMTAPPVGTQTTPEVTEGRTPPKGGAGTTGSYAETPAPPPPAASPPATSAATIPPPAPGAAGLKPCPSCGKEIPSEYLVCPFCNAVTQ